MPSPYSPFDADSRSGCAARHRAARSCAVAWRSLLDATEAVVLCGVPRRRREPRPPAGDCAEAAAPAAGRRHGPSPYESASCLSRVYFAWATPLVALAADGGRGDGGDDRRVGIADLWPVHGAIAADSAAARLEALWAAERGLAAAAGTSPRLERALWRSVRRDVAVTFTFKMGWLAFALLSNALLLKMLVDFIAAGAAAPAWHGYALALGILGAEALRSACVNQHWLTAVLAGIRLRAGARSMLYAKALRLRGGAVAGGSASSASSSPSSPAPSLASVGATVNLLTNDAQRLLEAASYGEFLLSTPPTLVACLAIMVAVLGPAALAGFAVLLLAVPLQARLGSAVGELRRRTIRCTDERAKLMSEVLGGVLLVKLAGWEAPVASRIAEVRAREVALMTRSALVRALNTAVVASAPSLVLLAAFGAHVIATRGAALEPSTAFVCVALFNVARFPLGIIPLAVRNVADARVAAARLQSFLELPEVGPDDAPVQLALAVNPAAASSVAADPPAALGSAPLSAAVSAADGAAASAPLDPAAALSARLCALCGDGSLPADDVVLEARRATFAWPEPPRSAGTPPLRAAAGIRDVSFSLRAGEVVAIVGPVGAGKSSLLASCLGQLERVGGCFAARGAVAFAAQSPWVFNASLRENVLLGDEAPPGSAAAARYAAALDACCLRPDIATLPGGDTQEIGERGVNLSGGQKARVALARALYADAPALLLDDPLSAVDAHVCAALWRGAIRGPLGAGGGRRGVLLVTHQTQYAAMADHVLVLGPGGVVRGWGSPSELTAAGIDVHGGANPNPHPAHGGSGDDGGGDSDSYDGGAGSPAAPLDVGRSGNDEVAGAAAAAAADPQLHLTAQVDPPMAVSPRGNGAGSSSANGSVPTHHIMAPADGATTEAVPLSIWTTPNDVATVAPAADDVENTTAEVSPTASSPHPAPAASAPPPLPARLSSSHHLVVAEERASGAVAAATVSAYAAAGGGNGAVIALVLALLLSKGTVTASAWFVAYWTAHPPPPGAVDEPQQGSLAAIFATIVAAVVATQLVQGAAFGVVTLRASRTLHDAVFASVMRATPAWFASQPVGRILSRFTGDLDGVDTALPAALEQSAEYLVACALALLLLAIVTPWFTLAAVPIVAAFAAIARVFRRAARELKRLDALARSPLVSHVTASVGGLATLRAFGRAPAYAARFSDLCDDTTRSYWALYAANRWVAVRLDWTTALTACASACLVVAARDSLAPGMGGLALSAALALAGVLQFATRLTSEAEAALTGVERLAYYASDGVPHERVTVGGPPLGDDAPAIAAVASDAAAAGGSGLAAAPPVKHAHARHPAGTCPDWYPAAWSPALQAACWPARGALAFSHVTVRHRADLPPALVDVSFSVPPGARVGVVGRTGCGKSTLLATLFRMLEVEPGGAVTLDGVDLARVNVYHVRSRLAAIPQDPVLFGGSLRSNLDPFGAADDGALWAALRGAGIEGLAASDPRGLGRPVAEGGADLSVGQRQLLCLARAMLRGARVVAMDESTASTDGATDAGVQSAIRRDTVGCTLLIVAHRLATVMDADRVLVLGAGRVLEYDTPAALLGLGPRLCEPRGGGGGAGAFAALVDEAGPAAATALRAAAAAHEAARAAAAAAAAAAVR